MNDIYVYEEVGLRKQHSLVPGPQNDNGHAVIMLFINTRAYVLYYTGRFIMFSGITNIYNRKTKGTTLMELFTATGKLKKFFFSTRVVRCLHHG